MSGHQSRHMSLPLNVPCIKMCFYCSSNFLFCLILGNFLLHTSYLSYLLFDIDVINYNEHMAVLLCEFTLLFFSTTPVQCCSVHNYFTFPKLELFSCFLSDVCEMSRLLRSDEKS